MNISIKKIGTLVLFMVSIFILSGCEFLTSQSTITSIEVEATTLEDSYDIDTFELSSISIKVSFSDGKFQLIPITEAMLSSEHLALLSNVGEHEITITYEGKTTSVTLLLNYVGVKAQLMTIYNLAATQGGFTGTYEEWLASIQGEAGEDGHSPVITIGTNGNWYIDGVDTLVQAQGLQGEVGNGISAIALTKTEGLVDTYTITYTDGTTSTFTLTNGADGKSAYEIYKENNLTYTKTEIEWLEDLINGNLVTVEAVKYTISFNSNGGSIIEEQQVIENKKIMEPANPTKDGYIFAGWYYGNERWSFIGYVVTENMTLTAKWNETDTYGITFDSQEFTYDGSAKTISITGNLPTGISVVYINNGKIDAGVHEVTARFIDTTIQNRIIPDLVATITIHKATISGIGFSGATYDYQKGTSRALQITGIIPSDVSVSYTNNNKENAGTYEVTATFIYSSNNYHPISDMNATLVINKLTIDMSSVALNSSTYLYDGQTKSLIITGLLPEGVSVTYINNDKINVGSYEVVANFTFIDEINYNLISDITATMTIMEADISGISISDATYIYDGLEKSLTITGTLPTGVSVSYTNNKKTNAGTYEVIATFTDSTGNYNKLPDMKANLVIEKKSLPSITFTNATYVYDGLVKSLSIVGTLPEGVSVSYENNNQINAGSYQVSAILADINNNYLLPTNLIATLTIQKATFDMSEITFEDQLYIDDNQEKTLLITGTLPSGVTVTYSNNKLTAPGELLVTATFIYDSQNYNQINPLTAKLTIIEVGARLDSPSIAFDGEWLDWGNNEKALKYIVNINGTLYETTNNYYQVPTSDRTSPDGFSIQVKTISNDSNYLDSLYSNTLTKLSTIKNITFVDGILSWDPVVGNQGYELKINNTIVSTNTNSFDLNSLSTNTYTISIHAKRIEDTKSTFHSEKVTIVVEKNGFSLNLKVQDYMIKWNGIVDATKYNISINGELVDTTETSYLLTNGVVGTNNIKVYTTVGSTYYFSSITVTKPSNITNFKLLDDTFTWDNVENATGYEVYVNGTIYDNKNSTTFALDDCFESGEYLVKIKAYSINSNYVYSNESSEISTTKLSNDINITNLNGELNWNPIANATNYQLLVGDNIYTTASTTYNLPLDGGEYVVSVKAVGDGVDYVISKESSSVTFTKLPKPILSYENWQISFNEITNATGYKLYYGDEIVELGLTRTYTIPNIEGSHTVIVEALGDGNYLNTKSNYLTITKLNNPTIKINNNGVSWNSVANATNYILIINNEEFYLGSDVLSYSINGEAGDYTVQLIAVEAKSSYVNFSATSSETFTKLNSVNNIINNNGFLTWDAVENAVSYKVTVNTSTYTTDTNSFDAKELNETGNQEISVKANNGINYINSNDSNKLTFIILDQMGEITIENSILSWNEVLNATRYVVLVNNQEVEVLTPIFTLDESFNVGTYAIQVRAIGDNFYLSSKFTTVKTITKLTTPTNVRLEDGFLKIDGVMNASGYRLEINGVEYDYIAATSFYMPQDVTESLLSIRIKALGNNTTYVHSEYTSVASYRKLATPEIYFEDGYIKWTSTTASATISYILLINNVEYNVGNVMQYIIDDFEPGIIEIKIRAIGSDYRISSIYSEVIVITRLASPANFGFADGALYWDEVSNATGYLLNLGSQEIYVEGVLSYEIGSIAIENTYIEAVGDNINYFNSSKNKLLFTTENGIKYIYYGTYPQTVVDDSALISSLNTLTSTNVNGYYEYQGEEYAKVVATPFKSGYKFINGETITNGATYYFKVERIKWRVLDEVDGTHTLLSEYIIDKQVFYTSLDTRTIGDQTIYANNYEHSTIREWLNNAFYNKAFSTPEKGSILTTLVDNSASTTFSSTNPYFSNNTMDKVYLLSYQEARSSAYGFSTSTVGSSTRTAITTDYARTVGAYMYTYTSHYGNGSWWLRSPYYSNYRSAHYVNHDGNISDNYVYDSYSGPRPAIKIG